VCELEKGVERSVVRVRNGGKRNCEFEKEIRYGGSGVTGRIKRRGGRDGLLNR